MIKLFLALIIFPITAFSQEKIKKVIAGKNGQPLAYTNIINIHSIKGTMTNDQGEFILEAAITDTFKLTNISFESRILSAKEILQMDTIFLTENIQTLAPIFINNFNLFKFQKEIGFFKEKGPHSYAFGPGSQLCVYLENIENKEGWIKKVHFKIKQFNQCKNDFRIRLLQFDTLTSSPGKDLVAENLIIPYAKLKKKNTLDVSTHHIIIPKEGLFMVIEWLGSDDLCANKSYPSIEAGEDTDRGITWINLRDRKWSQYKSSKSKVGTPKIGITVTYQ
ncbi:MAG: hypothetical protein ABI208_02940 [Ginsengibacter sp.]